jgi:NADPH:quinone reductase-like Zn-dependent oxidoreductase
MMGSPSAEGARAADAGIRPHDTMREGTMTQPTSTDRSSQTMMALRAHTRGGPETLVYEAAPAPAAPAGTDIRVKVRAAAITFDELTWDETWEVNGVDRTPIVPSHEFAGVVVATGPEVTGLSTGDEVFGLVPFERDGAAAQYVLAPAASVAPRPAGVSAEVAAAAVLPGLTAMEALDDHLAVAAGGRLLVHGGTGAVGSFLTQLAHARGIEVAVTVRSAASAERARRLGADHVFAGDETGAIPAGSFDAAIDAVGADTPEWLYPAVRRGGRVITLQVPPDAALAEAAGVDASFFVVNTSSANLTRLGELLAAGELETTIAQTFPLSEGRAAYASRGAGRPAGKTILSVPDPEDA